VSTGLTGIEDFAGGNGEISSSILSGLAAGREGKDERRIEEGEGFI
jgi:hypothetical protein